MRGKNKQKKKREIMSYLHLGCSSLAFPTTSSSAILKQLVITVSFPLCSTELQAKSTKSFFSDFKSKSLNWGLSGALALGISLAVFPVNKPELLPKEFTTVIDVAGFPSDGQEKRLAHEIADIEKDTGFKLRILAQNYPDTPGLTIRDFWQVDDRTIVFVADPHIWKNTEFNVGATVDLDIPRSFWSRLAGKYGNIFYCKEKGEDASIESAVMAISSCSREPVGPNNCSEVK